MTQAEVITLIICIGVAVVAMISGIEGVKEAEIKSKAKPTLVEIKVRNRQLYDILSNLNYYIPSQAITLITEIDRLCKDESEDKE